MNKLICISLLVMGFFNCSQNNTETDDGLYGLGNYERFYDFDDTAQLSDLPSHGNDPSYIEN